MANYGAKNSNAVAHDGHVSIFMVEEWQQVPVSRANWHMSRWI